MLSKPWDTLSYVRKRCLHSPGICIIRFHILLGFRLVDEIILGHTTGTAARR